MTFFKTLIKIIVILLLVYITLFIFERIQVLSSIINDNLGLGWSIAVGIASIIVLIIIIFAWGAIVFNIVDFYFEGKLYDNQLKEDYERKKISEELQEEIDLDDLDDQRDDVFGGDRL